MKIKYLTLKSLSTDTGLAFFLFVSTAARVQGSKVSASSSSDNQKSSPNSEKRVNRPLLRSDEFVGRARLGYEVANKHQELLKQLFPCGGGDVTEGFTSLYDPFTTDYAADDPLCQDEAILAGKLAEQRCSLTRSSK